MRKLLKNDGVQTFLASIICILLGLLIGFIALLIIEPSGAVEGMSDIMKNFLGYSNDAMKLKYFGSTMVKTAPLVMCSLSILFAYKVGLFNIGAAGQYVMGACAGIYGAVVLGWSWLPCVILAAVAGMIWAVIVGVLKAYCNVNEVISGIMLNWIGLYLTNIILAAAKTPSTPYTYSLQAKAKTAVLPTLGLDGLLGNSYAGLAIPLAVLAAVLIWILLEKTKLGYELKATGYNKNAAKYAGMAEKKNIILTLAISGALAGLGGSFLYLTDIQQWEVGMSSVPGMGFNGIAAAFLGGLNPIGTVFASFFIQHITDGGGHIDLNLYCTQVSDLISAIIIYLCGFVGFMKYALNRRLAKAEEAKGGNSAC
jgi:simple sugar transport system permease protein